MLRGIDSNSVDLIYLDPPFNKGKAYHAPIGTLAEGASFSDIWSPDDVKDELHNQLNDIRPDIYSFIEAVGALGKKSFKYYLIYMGIRLLEMHRVLKEAGSLFLHCDPTASHALKLLLDGIFGNNNFRNEIVWAYHGPGTAHMRQFNRKHDLIYWYSKGDKWTFNRDGVRVPYVKQKQPLLTRWNEGIEFTEEELAEVTRKGKVLEDWWVIRIAARCKNEYRGYPTQKPLKLLERVICGASNQGDLILDPFCGCATTCVAAEKFDRNWIGIDVSPKAYELVQQRLKEEVPETLFKGEVIYRADSPIRTDRPHKQRPTEDDKWKLFRLQNEGCAGCTAKFSIRQLEFDHKVPQAHGGSHEIENLQLLCGGCNREKGTKPMQYLVKKRKLLRLDTWQMHAPPTA